MDEKFEQSTEKGAVCTASGDVAASHQEVPEDMKSKLAAATEARKLGKTPSSVDLPKFDLSEVKADSVVAQTKLPDATEQNARTADAPVCKEGAPVCDQVETSADPHKGETPVSAEKDAEGRTVREKYASGPDMVTAYDDKGEPHKFVDAPIKNMPPDFGQIPEWRKDQLDQQGSEILGKYASPTLPGNQGERLDFQKVADMQHEIAARKDLTETEKCQMYSKIQETIRETPIPIENWNEKPEHIDSWSREKDPYHAVAAIDDKYHNRLVNMTPEEASKAIFEQEDRTEGDMHPTLAGRTAWKIARAGMGINQGDINASEGQLKCMRQLKEKGTFGAYADEWEKQFVKKDGVNPHIGEGGAGMD